MGKGGERGMRCKGGGGSGGGICHGANLDTTTKHRRGRGRGMSGVWGERGKLVAIKQNRLCTGGGGWRRGGVGKYRVVQKQGDRCFFLSRYRVLERGRGGGAGGGGGEERSCSRTNSTKGQGCDRRDMKKNKQKQRFAQKKHTFIFRKIHIKMYLFVSYSAHSSHRFAHLL